MTENGQILTRLQHLEEKFEELGENQKEFISEQKKSNYNTRFLIYGSFVAIVSSALYIGIWVGTTANRVEKLEQTDAERTSHEARISVMESDNREIKATQRYIVERVDQIYERISQIIR